MQIKFKTGKAVDLTEDEIKEILHDYKACSGVRVCSCSCPSGTITF